jgi:hypothetical protein
LLESRAERVLDALRDRANNIAATVHKVLNQHQPKPSRIPDLASGRVFPYLEGMEVHFTPETEKKLKDLATQSGRGTDDLVEDALAGYFAEALQVREMLNSRYHDLKSGKVKPIPGDKVEAYFREKSAAVRRSQQPGS